MPLQARLAEIHAETVCASLAPLKGRLRLLLQKQSMLKHRKRHVRQTELVACLPIALSCHEINNIAPMARERRTYGQQYSAYRLDRHGPHGLSDGRAPAQGRP